MQLLFSAATTRRGKKVKNRKKVIFFLAKRMQQCLTVWKITFLFYFCVTFITYEPSPCRGISAEILPLNLNQISSIYRLTGSFLAIWDSLQWFVSITGLILLYRYHIDMRLWYALRVSKGTLNPEKTNKQKIAKGKCYGSPAR